MLRKQVHIIAVSGGADSTYLAHRLVRGGKACASIAPVIAHAHHGARGAASDNDEKAVRAMGDRLGVPVETCRVGPGEGRGKAPGSGRQAAPSGFEEKARNARYAFLMSLKRRRRAEKVVLGHTADDQVETVLMRILEGAGISGLKGIPRCTKDGIERPLLDTWREEILAVLHRRKIPYRIDRSNADTRFERNWIRHVLIPLLEKRYGKAVKKRIHVLGERFREIDEFLDVTARGWLRRHVRAAGTGSGAAMRERAGVAGPGKGRGTQRALVGGSGLREGGAEAGHVTARVPRKPYSRLPAAVRKKIVQLVFFERLGIVPNERLLESVDRLICRGGPSAALDLGTGTLLRCRYDDAFFLRRERPVGAIRGPARRESKKGGDEAGRKAQGKAAAEDRGGEQRAGAPVAVSGPGRYGPLTWEERGRVAPAALRRIAEGEWGAGFDADALRLPLTTRPLRAGDRIRPFGLDAEKKVKEILIDRKVPRDERWGRLVVCDAVGNILWIPGVVRSADAPLGRQTRRTIVLKASFLPRDSSGSLPSFLGLREREGRKALILRVVDAAARNRHCSKSTARNRQVLRASRFVRSCSK